MTTTDPLIGKTLGDYNIESILGTGGMARVYKGLDTNLERYAAIKVVEPQLVASTDEAEYRERFLREARAIARLSHPNIVSIYQYNQVGNLYYIAMEYAPGDNLRDVLKSYIQQGRVMPTDELLVVLQNIADALDYAHKQNIIHRDVKPSNIIVNEEGRAVLTDFGLALNAMEGTVGNTFGSVHYIAPEQAISSAQSVAQSDQYSLGIVAYELLTGRVPFDDASAMSVALKHISDPPPPPTELNPNIPAEVEQVLLRSLDKEPNRRYGTCREFVNALDMAFAALDNADVEAPQTITEAKDGEPATKVFPPLEEDSNAQSRADQAAEKLATDATLVDADDASRPNMVTPTAEESNQRGLYVAAAVVLLLIVGGAGLFFSGILGDDVPATETAAFVAAVATQDADATNTAQIEATQQQETALALAIIETDDASTAIAQETSDAATVSAQEIGTENAISTATEQANIDSAETEQAIIDSTETAESAEASAEAEQASDDSTSTAESESVARTSTAEANDEADDATAQVAVVVDEDTETPTPIPSPTPSLTPSLVPTNTPDVTPTLFPTNTPLPTNTASPTPTLTPTPLFFINTDQDTRQLLLRYDGRTLLLTNRDPIERIDLSNLQFVLFERDDTGAFAEAGRFRMSGSALEEPSETMTPDRCMQVLDARIYSALPAPNDLADELCLARPFWVSTGSTFWLSDTEDAYFEVRISSVDVVGRCPAQTPETVLELRCAVDINTIIP
ncbi:MAG: protein kinase [Chloroflexota bacterium]